MTAEAPPTTPPAPLVNKPKRSRRAIGVGILVALVAAYGLSLLGVHLLEKSEGALPPLDLSAAGPDETVAQVRLEDASQTRSSRIDDNASVVVNFHRAKGPLIFDLGICLVLISLPTLALLVAIPMALGRRKFLPPFATWYAANLFAIVPLRNILPGAPPPGSWVDQAIVQWVLIALAAADELVHLRLGPARGLKGR